MKHFPGTKIVTISADRNESTFVVISGARGGEATVLFGKQNSYYGDQAKMGPIELSAAEAAKIVERLKDQPRSRDGFGAPFETKDGPIRLTVSRQNDGEPYSEGFNFDVTEYGVEDWGKTVFYGYFEDGYAVDLLIEIFQHCVDLNQKLQVEAASFKP